MQDKKFFCIEPFVSLSIVKEDHIFPCCLHEGQKSTQKDDLWNDPYLNKIRKQILNDEVPDECRACVEQEKFGRQSRRTHSNALWLEQHGNFENYFENDAPYQLDFWTGNLCNLACSTCTYDNSSIWFSLLKKANKKGLKDINYYSNKTHNLDYSYEYKKEGIPNIDFKNLEIVHFNGGEPLLTDTHLEILNLIPKEKRKDVYVLYNTNGTVRIDLEDEKWDIFKEFQSVDMCFSIDGIRDTFEYVRWPAKWEEVRSNIDLWASYCYSKYPVENRGGGVLFQMSFNLVKTSHNFKVFDETVRYVTHRWVMKLFDAEERKNHTVEEYVVTINDYRFMDWTDEQFEEYIKTDEFKLQKKNLEILRSL